MAELAYWDPSVVVAALNHDFVKQQFQEVDICVDMRPGITHGTLYVNTTNTDTNETKCEEVGGNVGSVSVFNSIDADQFYQNFFSTLNGKDTDMAIGFDLNNLFNNLPLAQRFPLYLPYNIN